ncbi:MAG: hypothetical protein ACHQF2_04190, partial [Flavobacteriales bacterium]
MNDTKMMKEKEFTDFMAAADKAFKEKDYGNASANYKKAYEVKPDPAVQKKITEIETLLKTQIAEEKKYEQLLADGNKAMLNSKWDDAIKNYQGALGVRADSKEAKDGLDKATAEKKKTGEAAAAEAKKQADFQAAMKVANDAMTAKKYDDAITGYDKALGIILDNAEAKTKK